MHWLNMFVLTSMMSSTIAEQNSVPETRMPDPPRTVVSLHGQTVTVKSGASLVCRGDGATRECHESISLCGNPLHDPNVKAVLRASSGLLEVAFEDEPAVQFLHCEARHVNPPEVATRYEVIARSVDASRCAISLDALAEGKYVIAVKAAWGVNMEAEYNFRVEKSPSDQ